MNRLDSKRIRRPERRRDVPEIRKPFDHQAHGIAPVLNRPTDPLLPSVQDVGVERRYHLAAPECRVPGFEEVAVREPPAAVAAALGFGPSFHLHQLVDAVLSSGKQLLDGVVRGVSGVFDGLGS